MTCQAPPTELPPQRLREHSEGMLTRVEVEADEVRARLRKANDAGDVILVVCLDQKLSQLDATLRTGRQHDAALSGALGNSDGVRVSNELQILRVHCERAHRLRVEADSCVGRPLRVGHRARAGALARRGGWA